MSLIFPQFRATSAPAFVPTSLGTSKLKLWLRPEGDKYQTSARGTLETGTGAIGSWTDESGNGNNADQSTGALRPSRKTGGGVVFAGAHGLATSAIGAWAGDYAIMVACKVGTFAAYKRFYGVAFDTGVNIMSGATDGEMISSVAQPGPPYGTVYAGPFSTGAVHWILDKRAGTAQSLSVDGGAPTTATVTGSALANSATFVGTDDIGSYRLNGDVYEVIVVAAPSAGDLTDLAAYMAARATAGVWT